MRILIFSVFLSTFFSTLFGQTHSEIRAKFMLIIEADIIVFPLDSAGFGKLPTVASECTEDTNGVVWHVQDLNNDGLKDLIFSGPCQPYYQTAIFLNNGIELKKVYDNPGRLVAVEKNVKGSKIFVYQSTIICGCLSDLAEIKIGANQTISQNHTQFYGDTGISTNGEFKTEFITGILRAHPIVYDSIYQDPCFPLVKWVKRGNHVDVLKNKEVLVINSIHGWDLVLHRTDENNSIVGWIKR